MRKLRNKFRNILQRYTCNKISLVDLQDALTENFQIFANSHDKKLINMVDELKERLVSWQGKHIVDREMYSVIARFLIQLNEEDDNGKN